MRAKRDPVGCHGGVARVLWEIAHDNLHPLPPPLKASDADRHGPQSAPCTSGAAAKAPARGERQAVKHGMNGRRTF